MPSLLDPDVLVKAFTPFAVRERAELEKYVRRVQDLERATFFTAKELTWNLPLGGDPQPRTWGDDALSAALSTMRQLWMPDEDGGFHRVRRMLEEHAAASGSPEGERAVEMLRTAGRQHRELQRGSSYGAFFEESVDAHGQSDGGPEVRPGTVLDTYFHGRLAHRTDGKEERIEDWEAHHGLHLPTLLDVTTNLGRFYMRFAAGPRAILASPDLLS